MATLGTITNCRDWHVYCVAEELEVVSGSLVLNGYTCEKDVMVVGRCAYM